MDMTVLAGKVNELYAAHKTRVSLGFVDGEFDVSLECGSCGFLDENHHAEMIVTEYLEEAFGVIEVRRLHVPVMEDGVAVGCEVCDWEHASGTVWPCGTLRALGMG